MDGLSALELQKRGMSELLPGKVELFERRDCHECFSSDPLNNGLSCGIWRWTTLGGPTGLDVAITELHKNAREISYYEAPRGIHVATSLAIGVNNRGGRIAILGRYPWNHVISDALRMQLLRCADWVSGGQLPVILETPAQVMVVPRTRPDKQTACLFLLNASIDSSPQLRLRLRGAGNWNNALWHTPGKEPVRLETEGDSEKIIFAPSLSAWSVGFLEPQSIL